MFEKAGLEDAAGIGAMDRLLDDAGKRVVAINETTRDEIRGIIAKGIEEGVPMRELGDRVRGSGAFTSDRAERIARTETATVLNQSQVQTFRSYGVQQVRVLDGTRDAPCADANGQIWTVEEALGSPIAHPNCVRDFVPIVVAEQLAEGGGLSGIVDEPPPLTAAERELLQRQQAARDRVEAIRQERLTTQSYTREEVIERVGDGRLTLDNVADYRWDVRIERDVGSLRSNQLDAKLVEAVEDARAAGLKMDLQTIRYMGEDIGEVNKVKAAAVYQSGNAEIRIGRASQNYLGNHFYPSYITRTGAKADDFYSLVQHELGHAAQHALSQLRTTQWQGLTVDQNVVKTQLRWARKNLKDTEASIQRVGDLIRAQESGGVVGGPFDPSATLDRLRERAKNLYDLKDSYTRQVEALKEFQKAGRKLENALTDYAKTNHHEDFAESYWFWLNNPQALKQLSPSRYEYFEKITAEAAAT